MPVWRSPPRPSARGMNQRADPLGLAQQVVGGDGLAGWHDMHPNAPLLEHRQRLRGNPQHPKHACGEYDGFGAVFDNLGDVLASLTVPWPSMLTRPHWQLAMRGDFCSLIVMLQSTRTLQRLRSMSRSSHGYLLCKTR